MSPLMEGHPNRLSLWPVFQRFLDWLQDSDFRGKAYRGWQGNWTNGPCRTLELYLTSALGSLSLQSAVLFQVSRAV